MILNKLMHEQAALMGLQIVMVLCDFKVRQFSGKFREP